MNRPIVSSTWLYKNLQDPDIVLLDASPQNNKADLQSDSGNVRIKGARYFDLKNDFSDQTSNFPNTLPSPDQFERASQELGINNSSKIVIYDNLGIYTSPRVWWMFKTMGHDEVFVLDGGLPDWLSQGFETEPITPATYPNGNFKADPRKEQVRDIDFITDNLETRHALVLDARSTGRFNGTTPEPREGLRGGHIPHSINIPYTEVLENGKYKSASQLRSIFKNDSINAKPLIFSCGSGITACIILLASELASVPNNKSVYDGSWTEWGQLRE